MSTYPFKIVNSQKPLLLHIVSKYKGKNPRAFNFTKERKSNMKIVKSYLEKMANRMKKWADKGRSPQCGRYGDGEVDMRKVSLARR